MEGLRTQIDSTIPDVEIDRAGFEIPDDVSALNDGEQYRERCPRYIEDRGGSDAIPWHNSDIVISGNVRKNNDSFNRRDRQETNR